jgi:Tfp pilus assembly protein PilN
MRIVPRLRLDFATRKRALPPGYWLLAAGAVFALFAGLAADERHAAAEKAAAEEKARRLAAAKPAGEVQRFDAVDRRLATPWGMILTAIDQAVADHVVLLTVEPDAEKGRIQIGAEGKTAEAMTSFVSALANNPAFASAVLVSHQVRAEDQDKPLRFMVAVQWRAGK